MNILRETRADQVRTGDTILTHFAYATLRPAITVAVVHREQDTNRDGETVNVIRYSGQATNGVLVERGYLSYPGDRVYIVDEAPFGPDVPGCGVFGALNADDLPDDDLSAGPAVHEQAGDAETELL